MKKLLLIIAVSCLCGCPLDAPAPVILDSGATRADAVKSADAGQVRSSTDSGLIETNKACVDSNGIYHVPNPAWTPGVLCSPSDPNFAGYRYPSRIAYCQRNISGAEKDAVAKLYGIPRSDYSLYEFDHYIPLSSGGSNDPRNLWPQPLAEAHDKDKVEVQAYNGLKNGSLTQDQAVWLNRAWRPKQCSF